MTRIPKWLYVVLALMAVLQLALPAFAADTKGVVKKVVADKKEIVVTIQGQDYPFQVAANAPIKLGNQAGKLSDLKPNDQVRVSFVQADKKLIATQIIRP
jgi:Cu/Ag efflux protein CusF